MGFAGAALKSRAACLSGSADCSTAGESEEDDGLLAVGGTMRDLVPVDLLSNKLRAPRFSRNWRDRRETAAGAATRPPRDVDGGGEKEEEKEEERVGERQ